VINTEINTTQNKGEATQNIAIPENVKKVKNEMEKLGTEGFDWENNKWKCLRCKSTDVKVIRFTQDQRLRCDVDVKLICQNCGNKEIL
jgi:hypothetical protein